jgi:AcrR family transcriptional regulator
VVKSDLTLSQAAFRSTAGAKPVHATQQRLLQAAFEIFSRRGFHAVGLDAVLREVGVSKQTFYNHFESRDDLILQVLRHRDEFEMDVWRERLVQVAGEDPTARLHALFDVLDIYFQDPEFRGCIFINAAAEFVSTADPAHQIAAGHVLALQQFIETLAQAAGAQDPGVLAEQLTILIQGAIVLRHVSGNPQAAHVARATAELLLQAHLPNLAAVAPMPIAPAGAN